MPQNKLLATPTATAHTCFQGKQTDVRPYTTIGLPQSPLLTHPISSVLVFMPPKIQSMQCG